MSAPETHALDLHLRPELAERLSKAAALRQGLSPEVVASMAIEAGLRIVSQRLRDTTRKGPMRSTWGEDLTKQKIGPFVVLGRADAGEERVGATPRWAVKCTACGLVTSRQGAGLRQARAGARRVSCFGCCWDGPPAKPNWDQVAWSKREQKGAEA